MIGLRATIALNAALLPLVTPACAAGFTLDDIEFWVGEGENRAGVAIDWNGDDLPLANSAPSLVWGYRWEGEAAAEDALRGLLAGDTRLFGKLAFVDGELGARVLGLGYDTNNDGAFAIEIDPAFMVEFEESFDPATGLADNQSDTFASSVDPGDAYEEGFNFNLFNPDNDGFWHFATTAGEEATGWSSSNVGVSGHALEPGSFIGLAFTPSYDEGPEGAFPNALVVAEPPATPGDFNQDTRVNAADYAVWRDALGDPESLAAWQANFEPPPVAATSVAGVPEPPAAAMIALAAPPALRRRRS